MYLFLYSSCTVAFYFIFLHFFTAFYFCLLLHLYSTSILIIGEGAKRARHYQGYTNSKIDVYMYVWTYRKHNMYIARELG